MSIGKERLLDYFRNPLGKDSGGLLVQLPAQSRTNLDQGCSGPCLVKFCTFPRMQSPQPHWASVPGFGYVHWENFFPST